MPHRSDPTEASEHAQSGANETAQPTNPPEPKVARPCPAPAPNRTEPNRTEPNRTEPTPTPWPPLPPNDHVHTGMTITSTPPSYLNHATRTPRPDLWHKRCPPPSLAKLLLLLLATCSAHTATPHMPHTCTQPNHTTLHLTHPRHQDNTPHSALTSRPRHPYMHISTHTMRTHAHPKGMVPASSGCSTELKSQPRSKRPASVSHPPQPLCNRTIRPIR